jgi:hypothetical protein
MIASNKDIVSTGWPIVLIVIVAVVGLKFLGFFPSWLFALILAALAVSYLTRVIK